MSFWFITLLAFAVWPPSIFNAHAEGARVWGVVDVTSEFPNLDVFSPSLRYLSVVVLLEHETFLSIRRYDKKKHGYRELQRIPVNFPDICSVSDAGNVSYQEYNSEIITVDRRGKQIKAERNGTCRKSRNNTARVDTRDFAAERALLCSISANTRIRTRSGQARIHEIAGIRGTLPGGQVLADAVTLPITARNVKYSDYGGDRAVVIIDTSKKTRNYCIESSLTPSLTDPKCQLTANSADGPFFRRYFPPERPYSSDETPIHCSYRLSYSMPQGFDSSNLMMSVEWLVGEYSPNTVVYHKDFAGPSGTPNIILDIGTSCGYIVELTATDPRLRNNAFGVGNLWCSHY